MSPERIPPYTRLGAFFKEHLTQITAASTVSLLTLNSLILLNHDETRLRVQATPATAPLLPPMEIPTTEPVLLEEVGLPTGTIPPEVITPACTKSTIPWLPETVARWHPYLAATAAHFQIPEEILEILMTFESLGNPDAESSQGAKSLMQVMESTAEGLAEQLRLPSFNLEDPATNIYLSGQYIRNYLDSPMIDTSQGFTTEVARKIAIAYNGGGRRLEGYLAEGSDSLPAETRFYSDNVALAWDERHLHISEAYNTLMGYTGAQSMAAVAAAVGTPPC